MTQNKLMDIISGSCILLAVLITFVIVSGHILESKQALPATKTKIIVVDVEPLAQPSFNQLYKYKLAQYIKAHSVMPDKIALDISENVLSLSKRPELLLAIFQKESTFNYLDTGDRTKYGYAAGLGQIMFSIHKDRLAKLGINSNRDLYDIQNNIKATDNIIAHYIKKNKGDIRRALGNYYGAHHPNYVNPIINNYLNILEIKAQTENIYANTINQRTLYITKH